MLKDVNIFKGSRFYREHNKHTKLKCHCFVKKKNRSCRIIGLTVINTSPESLLIISCYQYRLGILISVRAASTYWLLLMVFPLFLNQIVIYLNCYGPHTCVSVCTVCTSTHFLFCSKGIGHSQQELHVPTSMLNYCRQTRIL